MVDNMQNKPAPKPIEHWLKYIEINVPPEINLSREVFARVIVSVHLTHNEGRGELAIAWPDFNPNKPGYFGHKMRVFGNSESSLNFTAQHINGLVAHNLCTATPISDTPKNVVSSARFIRNPIAHKICQSNYFRKARNPEFVARVGTFKEWRNAHIHHMGHFLKFPSQTQKTQIIMHIMKAEEGEAVDNASARSYGLSHITPHWD